jgi:hypothetical protein
MTITTRTPMLPDDRFDGEIRANTHPPDWRNPEPQPRDDLVVIGGGTAGLVSAGGGGGGGERRSRDLAISPATHASNCLPSTVRRDEMIHVVLVPHPVRPGDQKPLRLFPPFLDVGRERRAPAA